MNDKLSLQDLADILSQQTQISKKEAEFFFKEFFQLILDRIYENDLVKVKDFGTFKLTAINSRESVDVNTGEKIEIPAHYRFTFLPDKALKELVNEPFSKYQTVLLEDGMDPSTVNFELQTNTEEDSDTIDDNEVLKVIQEQVKLVNELKTQPTQPKTELGKTKARGSKIELIEKIPETTLSKKDEASYRSTQKPFVYTYSNSKIDENKKDEDIILMTVPRRNRIPKIGEDSNVADVSKESVVKSDNLSSKKIEDKKEVKDTDRKTELVNKSGQSNIDDSSIDIETTIYSISDTISKEQEVSVEKQRESSNIDVDRESTTVKTRTVPSDREPDLVSQENIPTLSRNTSTVSADKRPADIKSYKSYNNPDRPLIPEEGNNNRARPDFISTKIDSNSINDVEEIDIDTTFLNIDNPDLETTDKVDKTLLPDGAKDKISDDSEVRDVENDPFFNFEAQSAKRAKLKKIIPITILILIVLAVLIYGLFKLFDVKYDYERYQGLGTSNLTMADTLPYLYEKEESLPLTVKDSSIIQDYSDSLSEKNTVVVDNEVQTDTLKSATVQNINGSLLFDGSEKNRKDEGTRNVSDNLSINIVNKAQYFLNKKNEVKDNDGSVHNLNGNQSNAIESSRYPIQPKTTSANSIKLEQGMTLRSIANKYYGNANYWVYIYMANKEKLPNPDAITVGLELSIPPLSQYGVIDAKDPLEIQRAQKMEMQVLG